MATLIKQTPLFDLHLAGGAKMVEFAGYKMPLMYPKGLKHEHLHCRAAAGLFDVSHMGQVLVTGPKAAHVLESLMPIDVIGLPVGQQRYGLLTNDDGGIIDDLMITNTGEGYYLVVNAARKSVDLNHLSGHAGEGVTVTELSDHALLALQGPKAVDCLAALNPKVHEMVFMDSTTIDLAGFACRVSRSGYTGEDGFEIAVSASDAVALATRLVTDPDVEWIGLGARDSLRLEAGLCLYGSDIDMSTTPIEANLTWAISPSRRQGERKGGFLGGEVILSQLEQNTVTKIRVGLTGETRAPVRAGCLLFDAQDRLVGQVTSGTFGPTMNRPAAMGYVDVDAAALETPIFAEVRGKRVAMRVAKMPFLKPKYWRGQ
uniref:glycine cleavage system aminomethyltransferase GcvT n=1 Tax=Thaumasiovibrio occultus TaxID=1891184 RepID=UPI000B35FBC0|nr:glycine cleavage system aminomethyltransferase GcvT [Thaumasiovibrio occultus]